jgi:periplasmic divalent cation tolerance protein
MDDLCMVYITASGRDEAQKIAGELVKEKLAACANIYDGLTSVYEWEGKMRSDSEAVMVIKTKRTLFEEMSKRVKELHSYSCPCIVALPLVNADKDFARWVRDNTK